MIDDLKPKSIKTEDARRPIETIHNMPEETSPIHFMMGEYKAVIPTDRLYSDNHMWLQADDEGVYRVGFTAYSVRLLQDVYFLDWTIDPQTQVRKKQDIGEIESSKALSTLFSPCDGLLTVFNEQLLDDPSAINTDGYGKGWLFKLKTDDQLVDAATYLQILESGWDKTQAMIKGQIN